MNEGAKGYSPLLARNLLPEAEGDWLGESLAQLPHIGALLSREPDPMFVLREAVVLARSRLGIRRMGIWLLKNEGKSAVGTWGVGLDEQIVDERRQRIYDNAGYITKMLENWRLSPHIYECGKASVRDGDSKVVGEAPHITVPLFNGEEIFGFVAVDGMLETKSINRDTGKFLLQFGQVVAHAYQSAQLKLEAARAIEKANVAERIKSEFLGMFGHEIRTPLNAIIGYAQLIALKEGADVEVAELADTIKDSGEHLSELVETIMNYANLSDSDEGCWLNPGDPIKVIESTLRGFGATYAEKGLELGFVHEGARPTVKIDAVSFRQIFTNLLQNALKFTEKGGVRVRALSREDKDGTTGYFITVTDSGIGIDNKDLDSIFEPFCQIRRKEKAAGSIGMGLTVVRKLVKQMGGEIKCESELGKGTTFSIVLRFQNVDTISNGASIPDQGQSDSWGRRILIVDDNQSNREVLRKMANCLGYANTDVACDGQEASEMLNERTYDLVLLDLHMPRMDGLSLTRLVREGGCCPLNQKIPIVGVTAFTKQHDREECLMAGMNDYIPKPIEIAAVQRALSLV